MFSFRIIMLIAFLLRVSNTSPDTGSAG
jgi:hypothetical protein